MLGPVRSGEEENEQLDADFHYIKRGQARGTVPGAPCSGVATSVVQVLEKALEVRAGSRVRWKFAAWELWICLWNSKAHVLSILLGNRGSGGPMEIF